LSGEWPAGSFPVVMRVTPPEEGIEGNKRVTLRLTTIGVAAALALLTALALGLSSVSAQPSDRSVRTSQDMFALSEHKVDPGAVWVTPQHAGASRDFECRVGEPYGVTCAGAHVPAGWRVYIHIKSLENDMQWSIDDAYTDAELNGGGFYKPEDVGARKRLWINRSGRHRSVYLTCYYTTGNRPVILKGDLYLRRPPS
jgi:hypothetical protein